MGILLIVEDNLDYRAQIREILCSHFPNAGVDEAGDAAEALQMLDALAAEGRLDPKQFYFRLSAVIRRYIERRFDFPAAEMTTEEKSAPKSINLLKAVVAQP